MKFGEKDIQPIKLTIEEGKPYVAYADDQTFEKLDPYMAPDDVIATLSGKVKNSGQSLEELLAKHVLSLPQHVIDEGNERRAAKEEDEEEQYHQMCYNDCCTMLTKDTPIHPL